MQTINLPYTQSPVRISLYRRISLQKHNYTQQELEAKDEEVESTSTEIKSMMILDRSLICKLYQINDWTKCFESSRLLSFCIHQTTNDASYYHPGALLIYSTQIKLVV